MKPDRNDPCPCGSGKKYKHCCERKVESRPAAPGSAEFKSLITLFNTQRYAELESQVRTLLVAYPNAAFAWQLLGGALQMQGKDALAAFQKTAEFLPDDAGAHYNLGVAFKSHGQLDNAVASYRRALVLKPDYVEALSNLGNVLKDLGQLDEAVQSYRQALVIQPNAVDSHNNLGTVLKDLGKFDEALACYRRALAIKPDYADAYYNLGNVLKDLGRLDEAVVSYRQVLRFKPDFTLAQSNLSSTLRTLGQTDEALLYSQSALEMNPHALQYAIQTHLLLPVIPASVDAITHWRAHYQNGIETLLNTPSSLDIPLEQLSGSSFYLAYHNNNDRPFMEALHRLFRARVPDLTFTASHVSNWQPPTSRGQRIKVGFLSEFLTDHTIGKHYKGFICHLDRSRFEVIVIHAPKAKRDSFRQDLNEAADKAITLPAKLKLQQQAVAEEQLDVLFYPDIGMSSSTYFLAYARLAPVQATSWGHPDTTGLDTMDYYVSAMSNEPENAQAYYSERLIRLNRLPCYFYQTSAASTQRFTRTELGLPESGTLYGCPQNLFKIHPDFDAVLAAIAEGDSAGHIVFPEGKYSDWTELIKARWAKTFPVLLERVVFMPRMNWDRFMAVMSHMDVLLDPLHFGSGNTLYDAMVCGTPVVTWPGQFGRGRNVAAAYRQMGIADAPIAPRLEDYAPLALALGRDTERRRALRAASLVAAGRELFEDMRAVREFESFLEAAVAAAGRGELLPPGWRPDIQTGQT